MLKFRNEDEKSYVILATWFKHYNNTGEDLAADKLIKRYSHTWEYKKLLIEYRIYRLYRVIKDGIIDLYLKYIVRM